MGIILIKWDQEHNTSVSGKAGSLQTSSLQASSLQASFLVRGFVVNDTEYAKILGLIGL